MQCPSLSLLTVFILFYFILFFKDFIYLLMRDTERKRGRDTGRGKQAPCREPDVGLHPGTPGSCLGLKADTKLLRHPGIPGGFRRGSVSLLLASRDCLHPLAHGPFPCVQNQQHLGIFKSLSCTCALTLTLLPPSYENPCNYTEPT